MITKAHGDASVIWQNNICISTLNGAFNEEGVTNWFLLVQQSWIAQGAPQPWVHVLDMFGWQGRTPETTPLLRTAVGWSLRHGLQATVILMEQGSASIFIRMNQSTNPVIPSDADVVICQSYEEGVAQLQRRQYPITLQQLKPEASSSRPELRAT